MAEYTTEKKMRNELMWNKAEHTSQHTITTAAATAEMSK
jgi:hypothetical protein